MAFKKAVRSTQKLRITLMGPPGSGKTRTSLEIATGLGGRIALIDSEKGSASLYGRKFNFDTDLLAVFDPRIYIEKIQEAEKDGYDVIIIDSLSHAWRGVGGTLDIVQKFTDRSKSKNSFTDGWSQGTPIQNALIDAIMSSPCHMIATLRTKIEYSTDNDPRTGKMSPKKIGTTPIQRNDVEYEFDIIAEMDLEHNFIITKTRFEELDSEVLRKPGKELGEKLIRLLNDTDENMGSPDTPSLPGRQDDRVIDQPTTNGHSDIHSVHLVQPVVHSTSNILPDVPPGIVTYEMAEQIYALVAAVGISDYDLRSALARKGVSSIERLTIEEGQAWIHKLQASLENVTAVEQLAQRIEGATPEQAAERAGARVKADEVIEVAKMIVEHEIQEEATQEEEGTVEDSPVEDSPVENSPADNYVIADQPRRPAPVASETKARKRKSASTLPTT